MPGEGPVRAGVEVGCSGVGRPASRVCYIILMRIGPHAAEIAERRPPQVLGVRYFIGMLE